MKHLLTLLFIIFHLAASGQEITSAEWNEQAKTNKRLLPKYGHLPKTEEEKRADEGFVQTMLEKFSSHREASNQLISLGFNYLYRDLQTAMYRFNQAYLLDSANSDIYWGYGAVYMVLGDYEKAREQYEKGLSLDPVNTHLLTDYGTYFMSQYYTLKRVSNKHGLPNLDSAISYLSKSFKLEPEKQNTTFKLSVCYWIKDDCENAWKYYNACKALGGQPITDEYFNDLKKKCKR